MSNQLGGAASSYLRQHAHQPVHWQVFGDDAFEEAERRDVPVFLSVGYAACHWCHVMAHETFDDPVIAGFLNQNFVSIKVDREERPDVDSVYMAATQLLTGQGGWPMSVFLMPDGRAFHAGTYFPPEPRQGLPSFRQLIQGVHDTWVTNREGVEQFAGQLAQRLEQVNDAEAQLSNRVTEDSTDADKTMQLALNVLTRQEARTGGFGQAPKFPPHSALEFLTALGSTVEGDRTPLGRTLLDRTLRVMALSGLHDHVAGGFARYCVDEQWLVPHFEKMLYDNAQLLRHYAHASHLASVPADRELFKRTAQLMVSWLADELLTPEGAFASSLDADTVLENGEHHEGATYVWTRAELEHLTDFNGALKTLLVGGSVHAPQRGSMTFADTAGNEELTLAFSRVPEDQEWSAWDQARPVFEQNRAKRPQPAKDDKVVASWNGLMVRSLAETADLLDGENTEHAELARTLAINAATFLWNTHVAKDTNYQELTVLRVSYNGATDNAREGLLEDYAGLALGFQAVAAVTNDHSWTEKANEILDASLEKFVSTHQGTTLVRDSTQDPHATADQAVLNARNGSSGVVVLEDATPSGTALLALALAQRARPADEATLVHLLNHTDFVAARAPGSAGMALAARWKTRGGTVREIHIAGGSEGERRAARRVALLSGAVITPTPSTDVTRGEYAAGPAGDVRIYICQNYSCMAPLITVQELTTQLQKLRDR